MTIPLLTEKILLVEATRSVQLGRGVLDWPAIQTHTYTAADLPTIRMTLITLCHRNKPSHPVLSLAKVTHITVGKRKDTGKWETPITLSLSTLAAFSAIVLFTIHPTDTWENRAILYQESPNGG